MSIVLLYYVENFVMDVDRDAIVDGVEDSQWLAHYAALVIYGRRNGHCNVPYKAYFECTLPWTDKQTNEVGTFRGNLGAWLMHQRQSRKRIGDVSALLPEREALLQQLVDQGKLLWDELPSDQQSSNTTLTAAATAAAAASNESLSWDLISVGVIKKVTQSATGRHTSTTATTAALAKTAQRTRQLELDAFWDRHFAALLEYGRIKGTYNVPLSVIFENNTYVGSLGNWVHLQRLARSGVGRKLNARQEAALVKLESETGKFSFEIGVIGAPVISTSANTTVASTNPSTSTSVVISGVPTDMKELSWEVHYAALLQYQHQHGHCNVPFDCVFSCPLPQAPNGRYHSTLGVWLYQQRVSKSSKHNRLSSGQEQSLQKLVDEGHLVWETSSSSSATSSVPVPVPVPTVSSTAAAAATINTGIVSASPHGETSWATHYAGLLQYCKEHGHCNVPKGATYECIIPDIGDNSPHGHYFGHLGSWLCYQRRLRKKEKSSLLPDREALLQQLVDEGIFVYLFISYSYCIQ